MDHPEFSDPQYRCDPITGHWVIFASERARRPMRSLPSVAENADPLDCPFCEGSEDRTPPEIDALRSEGSANGPGWKVRVVPNRYPAVLPTERPTLDLGTVTDAGPEIVEPAGPFERVDPGFGFHEVIIECPDHRWTISGLSDEHVGRVFSVYRDRLRALRKEDGLAYALLFKNAGQVAGATQEHAHSQILATSHLPAAVEEEVRGFEKHYRQHHRCIFCDLMGRELDSGDREVLETEEFLAWCPFVSRFPLEVWISPKRHQSRFEQCSDEEMGGLGTLVKRLLVRLERLISPPAYNYFLHTEPFAGASSYHWHLEIVPRYLGFAGFELGGNMYINPVLPESSAQLWRGNAGLDLDAE